MATPNSGDMPSFTPPAGAERTRLSVIGELSFKVGSLMEVLDSLDSLAQKDRILEFATLSPNALPEVFKSQKVDNVTVIFGTLQTNDNDQAAPIDERTADERHITLRIRSGYETLVINRSTDPTRDPSQPQDIIEFTHPGSDDVEPLVLDKDVSVGELNRVLVGLIANSSTGDLLAAVDFLNPDFYGYLSEVLEAEAPLKGYTGIHVFADGDAELEFTKVGAMESFKITYLDRSSTPPRYIAAAASSIFHFDMRFFTMKSRDIREQIFPKTKDSEILIRAINEEMALLHTSMSRDTAALHVAETNEDEVSKDAEQRIIDSKATRIALDETLHDILYLRPRRL